MQREMIKRKIEALVSIMVKNYIIRGLDVRVYGNNLAERVIEEAAKDVKEGDLNFGRVVVLMAEDLKRIDALQVQGNTGITQQYESVKDIPDDVFKRSLTQPGEVGGPSLKLNGSLMNSGRSSADGGSGQRGNIFLKEYSSINDIPDDVFANSFKLGGGSIIT